MNAKAFMKQINKLDKLIENKLAEREQWKSIALGTTSNTEKERVQSSGSQQRMAEAVERYVDLEAEIDRCIDELIEVKKDVISVIEKLPVFEYDVLHKVYIQHLTMYEVAALYDKSYSWATTIHGRALKNVQKILNARKEGDQA